MHATIYAMCDSGGEVRYIGKTSKTLSARLRSHLADARRGMRDHRCNWIRSLGHTPTILPMATVREEQSSAAERFAIALYRAAGYELVNGTDGGEGMAGFVFSPESRAKMRAAKLGRQLSAEHRRKIGAAGLGRKMRPFTTEHRARISAAGKGKIRSPEFRARVSAALRGRVFSAEHCAKISAAKRSSR